MKKDQKHIYYVIAENFQAIRNSPHPEIFRKKGVEVLLMSDRVDEWLTSHLSEFDGKGKSISKGDVELDDQKDEKAKKKQEKTQRLRGCSKTDERGFRR